MATRPMIATGEWLTAMVRNYYTKHLTVFRDLALSFPTMTLPQVVALLEGRARLEGDTGAGITYVEEETR